jgi:hypothetical protein
MQEKRPLAVASPALSHHFMVNPKALSQYLTAFIEQIGERSAQVLTCSAFLWYPLFE